MLKGDKKLERTSTSQTNNNLSIKKKNDYDHKIFFKTYVSIEIPQKKKKKKGKEKIVGLMWDTTLLSASWYQKPEH